MPGETSSERPRLAPSTWLVGQLDQSALANPPWAVERAKRGYIQMGELAYHVAEQADGERTVGEIAHAVTLALGRPVSVSDVNALIHTVLVPRGVMEGPGGYSVDDELALDDHTLVDTGEGAPTRQNGPPRGQRGRSAAGNAAESVGTGGARERVIGAAVLERVAAILMWLYWPPVMLVVVGVGLGLMTWLLAFHGLAASMMEVLGQPLLLVLALVLALLAMGLQPIGPMVALYGAGAQIVRLRITPSLRHPSVVLDVADDYGLSRWARLTVDVSGVYLQLVAALAFCLLGMFNGAEFLFLTVLVLALNIVRLLLPFGRPGADRLLADLLLVPEPLLYAEQSLERLAPGNRTLARVLPPLKRWGWATIGVYLAATAVVLLVAGLTLLGAVPTVIATVLAALVVHVSDALAELGDRDAAGFAMGLLQTIVLALTVFVLAVVILAAVGRLVAGVWSWGRGSGGRQPVVWAGACVAAVTIVLFWVPIPRSTSTGTRSFRPLLGTPYRAMSPISRGTISDVFAHTSDESTLTPVSDEPPSVTTDIGSGPVGAPSSQTTPGTGAGGAPSTNAGTNTGAGGAPSSAATPGAPAPSTPAWTPTTQPAAAQPVVPPTLVPAPPVGGSPAPR